MNRYFNSSPMLPYVLLNIMIILSIAGPIWADDLGEGEGETLWRWIGIRSSDAKQCPTPADTTGWQSAPLFSATDNSELQRFCLFESQEARNPKPLMRLGLERLDPDVMGVAAQGSELAAASWRELSEDFLARAGQIDLSNKVLPGANVRLAVVDASPTGTAVGAKGPEDVDANSPHGTALLNMARDLLCDSTETNCRATVASRLAMAWECFDATQQGACRNAREGGYVGLIGELATAIHREVSEWQGSPERTRLVLNLSLGWHQDLGGAQSMISAMPTPAQAVYRVLEDAVCRGALPIAAAGNRDAAAVPQSGPFLPALWETRPAPNQRACRQLGIRPAANLGAGAKYRPLVFSVAGVEADGGPLDMTRPDGVARLAAFADHAVVTFADTGDPTGTLTGSSVAALVVSSTAAAVWSYHPRKSAPEIMASIYADGEPLGRNADYCLKSSKGCPAAIAEVHQVTLCEAVAGACGRSGKCGVPKCEPAAPLDLSGVDLSAFDKVTEVDMTKIDDQLNVPVACAGETVLYDDQGTPPTDPCPHRQYDGALNLPWTEPQPESIPCPNCLETFGSPGTLYFEVDDRWQGPLSSATLHCGGTSYALGLGPLKAGDQVRLVEVPEACLTAFPTFMSFTHRQDRAALSPLRSCQDCR